MLLSNPIVLSVSGLVIITVICILILAMWKPNFVLKPKETKKLYWGKLISVSVVIGILAGIILFILTMKSTPPPLAPLQNKVNMGFGNKLSDCY